MVVNVRANRVIPRDNSTLQRLCRTVTRRYIKQIEEKRISVRRASKKLGISHPTMLAIMEQPDKILSRKTMVRIVQRGTKRQLVKPKMIIPAASPGFRIWNHHTI
jgi:hypothetical protein